MRLNVNMKGFRELEQALAEELPKATAKNVLRKSATAAMQRIETRAKALVPVDDGTLRDSIMTKNVKATRQSGSVKFARSTGVSVATGPTGREEGGVGAFQEFGTVKQSAQPFMRPSADAEGQNVIDDIRQVLTENIDKAKARIAKKASKG